MSASGKTNVATKVGIGIGVGVPILVLIVLGIYCCGVKKQRLRSHKRRRTQPRRREDGNSGSATNLGIEQRRSTDLTIKIQPPSPIPPSQRTRGDATTILRVVEPANLARFGDASEPTLAHQRSANAINAWRQAIEPPRGRRRELRVSSDSATPCARDWSELIDLPTLKSVPQTSSPRRLARQSTDDRSCASDQHDRRRRHSSSTRAASRHRRRSSSTTHSGRRIYSVISDGRSFVDVLKGESQPMRVGLLPTHQMSIGTEREQERKDVRQRRYSFDNTRPIHHQRPGSTSRSQQKSDSLNNTIGSSKTVIIHKDVNDQRDISQIILDRENHQERQLRTRQATDDLRRDSLPAAAAAKASDVEPVGRSSHHRRLSSDATLIALPHPQHNHSTRRGHHRRYSSDATVVNPPSHGKDYPPGSQELTSLPRHEVTDFGARLERCNSVDGKADLGEPAPRSGIHEESINAISRRLDENLAAVEKSRQTLRALRSDGLLEMEQET